MFETKKKNEKAKMQRDRSKNFKIEKVHERALAASREYLKAEHVLFEIICELDQYNVASYYEYSSLYDYCLKALHLSEAVTCNMIAVARKSKQVPELKAAVMKGEVSVSTASINQRSQMKRTRALRKANGASCKFKKAFSNHLSQDRFRIKLHPKPQNLFQDRFPNPSATSQPTASTK